VLDALNCPRTQARQLREVLLRPTALAPEFLAKHLWLFGRHFQPYKAKDATRPVSRAASVRVCGDMIVASVRSTHDMAAGRLLCRRGDDLVASAQNYLKGANMPYVSDNSRPNWIGDDGPISPASSDFVYLPTKEFGGSSGPAKLRIPTDGEPNSGDEFENLQEARALQLSLKASGVANVYCQYDGGNDEGFAWVDHAELSSGEKLDLAALAKRLIANGVLARKRTPWQTDWSDERVIQEMLDFSLAVNWAAGVLGGRSFGTGNYSLYGAFAIDLIAETITDDPNANPIVRHIKIDGVDRAPGRFDPTEAMKACEATDAADHPAREYKVGDRMVHAQFGSGIVFNVNGKKLTVAFDTGKKRILDDFVERE
jgi:hypothetical protein